MCLILFCTGYEIPHLGKGNICQALDQKFSSLLLGTSRLFVDHVLQLLGQGSVLIGLCYFWNWGLPVSFMLTESGFRIICQPYIFLGISNPSEVTLAW